MASVLAGLANRPLTWTQPHALTPAHELRNGEALLGTLEFRSRFGTLAYAKIENDCWTLKRLGFLKTRVEIRTCDSEKEFATFHNATWTGGGTLALKDGRELRANTNFWHSRYEFVDDRDNPIVRYASGGFIKTTGEMEILPAGIGLPELSCIVMLGWYLVIMMRNDGATAAAS
jgi:hypothetical protein